MDDPRNNHIFQIPNPHHHFIGNRPPIPSFLSNLPFSSPTEKSFNHPHPIDVDQSLSGVFSLLNLSPARHCSMTPGDQFGSSVNNVGDVQGFVPSVKPQVFQSDVGLTNPFTVDPQLLLLDHQRYFNFSSDFDYGFDFDQKSYLGSSKKFLHSTFVPINNKPKFHMSDEHKHLNSCYNTYSQNHSFISSLKELRGMVYSLATDQNGCRILQAMFESPTIEEIEFVLSEVVGFIADLMKDQFGNYLFQKLVVLCNDDQKMRLLFSLMKVPTDIIRVSMNPHGTRSVQKLLENLKDPIQVKLIIRALHRGAVALANDLNGHHVIQYCLVHYHSDINKPILTAIADECFKVATDRSGCCVLQACVDHSRGEVRMRLVAEIVASSLQLAEDPFGNYVLQHMLGLNIPEFTLLLVRQLKGNFASLSCNKYASNVVEKCLNECGEEVSTHIVLELIRSPNSSLLLVDPFANFVIQSALKVSKGFAYNCLCGPISKNASCMRTNLYGRKILERFEKQ